MSLPSAPPEGAPHLDLEPPSDAEIEEILREFCDTEDAERRVDLLVDLSERVEAPADPVRVIAEGWRREDDRRAEQADELAEALDDPDQRELDKWWYRHQRAVVSGKPKRADAYARRAEAHFVAIIRVPARRCGGRAPRLASNGRTRGSRRGGSTRTSSRGGDSGDPEDADDVGHSPAVAGPLVPVRGAA